MRDGVRHKGDTLMEKGWRKRKGIGEGVKEERDVWVGEGKEWGRKGLEKGGEKNGEEES